MKTKRRFSASSRASGFTLIEALIAIIIATLGAISTLSLLAFTRLHNEEEQERSRAHQMVSQKMEEIRYELYTAITPGEDVVLWDNGTPADTTDDTPGVMTVTMWDADGNELTAAPTQAQRIQVEVTLTWNPRGRRADQTLRESVMTYIAP